MADASPDKTPLISAVDICEGQAQLARKLSDALGKPVSQQWVWNIINRPQAIPAEWCLPIEEVTKGKVTRHQLRPDLYPADEPVADSAPEHARAS